MLDGGGCSDYCSEMPILVKDSRGRSPFWIHCYTSAEGRRLKKSTKQTDKKKAIEVALAVERAESMARQGTLTEARARDLIGEVLERTSGETLPLYTAEGWLREWLEGKAVSRSANTCIKYSHTVNAFLTHLGSRAKINIAAVIPKDVATFRDAQLATGKHPNTVRYAIKQLRIPFNAARRQGIITHNPADAVELPTRAKTSEGAEGTRDAFTPEQVAALADAAVTKDRGKYVFDAAEEWRGLILVGYFTGARLLDAANIAWNCIDLPRKLITYRARKTGKLVTVPIHPELEDYLLELPAPDSGKALVFPKLAARGTGGRNGLSMAFSRIMHRAGVVGPILRKAVKDGAGRTVRALTFHSLRHSFNSAMANAGVSQEVRMALTGHASPEMNKGYTHHEIEPLRNAVGHIPRLPK
jgi:integrase